MPESWPLHTKKAPVGDKSSSRETSAEVFVVPAPARFKGSVRPPYSVPDPRRARPSGLSRSDEVEESLEFEPDGKYFRGGFEPRETDVFIAVMGVTGAGKSTFISHCTDQEVRIGHSLQACTQTVTAYCCRYSADVNVYLVDTPGFDDTNRSDLEVLKEVAAWLTDSFRKNIHLNGILYLHRITDPRMQGSAMRSLGMFRKLCGDQALRNVILVTTMWEKLQVAEGEARVQELVSKDEFWGCMIKRGSRVERHTNDRESAMRLIKALLHRQGIKLRVQEEMVEHGKKLDETGAGMELEGLLARERAKWQREMEQTQADYRAALDAKDEEWAAMLKKQEQEVQEKLRESVEKSEELKVTMEAMHKERYRKLEAMLEKTQKEVRDLKRASVASLPRTRSHPGRNMILKFRSLTLLDNHFYFCGPASSEGSLPKQIQAQVDGRTGLRLVALGTKGSYFIHYHDYNGSCKNLTHLPSYPALSQALASHTRVGCPKVVSLGLNGNYFVRFANRATIYQLPEAVTSQWDFEIRKIKAVWLGAEDSFVMMRADRKRKWSANLMDGLYPGLRERINAPAGGGIEVRIKALAMNLTNPKCYAIAWRDGKIAYNSDGAFDEFMFEEFATKNFGTLFM